MADQDYKCKRCKDPHLALSPIHLAGPWVAQFGGAMEPHHVQDCRIFSSVLQVAASKDVNIEDLPSTSSKVNTEDLPSSSSKVEEPASKDENDHAANDLTSSNGEEMAVDCK
jgi:hypothetical protein